MHGTSACEYDAAYENDQLFHLSRTPADLLFGPLIHWPRQARVSTYITRELVKEHIKGTNREEDIDPNEQCLGRLKGGLTRSG